MAKDYETDYMERIIENAKTAAEQWNEFAREIEDIDSFKNSFHLRPTASGVTIVSTLDVKPMRGRKAGRTVVKRWLNDILKQYAPNRNKPELNTDLTDLGFQDRKKPNDKKNEELFQARMIREMADNSTLKEFLGVDELTFVASEFILHAYADKNTRERIDIIAYGYDGNHKLFFFELKTPDNTTDKPKEQLVKYMQKYGEQNKDKTLAVLRNYPINPVECDDDEEIEFEGYVAIGYGNKIDLKNSKRASSFMEPGTIKFVD